MKEKSNIDLSEFLNGGVVSEATPPIPSVSSILQKRIAVARQGASLKQDATQKKELDHTEREASQTSEEVTPIENRVKPKNAEPTEVSKNRGNSKEREPLVDIEDKVDEKQLEHSAKAKHSEEPTHLEQSDLSLEPCDIHKPENIADLHPQRRISQKQRKESLEAYKETFLAPQRITNRKVVYLSEDTRERLDFVVRRLGDKGANVSSFLEQIARHHLDEYGDDIERWRKL